VALLLSEEAAAWSACVAADAHLEGHAGLLVPGDRALAGHRPGDRADRQRGLLAVLEVGRPGPAVQGQVVHDRALVDHLEGQRRARRDLDHLGDDGHVLEHDLERLRRAERALGGRGERGRAAGLQPPDPPPHLSQLDRGHQQHEPEHGHGHAQRELLEREGGLLLVSGIR
jgi:hypothetical protein